MSQMLSEEEFEEIADELLVVFKDRDMSGRDAVRLMMMVAIESCIRVAPSLSVALAELTKLFVQTLSPAVNQSMKAEIEDFLSTEGEEDEEV